MSTGPLVKALGLLCFLMVAGSATPLGGGASQAVTVKVRVNVAHAARPDHPEILVRCAEAEERVVARASSDELLGLIAIVLDPGAACEVSARADGFWAPPVLVLPGRTPQVDLQLLRMGTIVLTAEMPKGVDPPPMVRARVAPAPREEELPKGLDAVFICPGEGGRYRCELPRGSLDVRVSADGFVPVYLWSAQVGTGGGGPPLAIELRTGASLSGVVEVVDGALDPSKCLVEIAPVMLGAAPSPAELGRRQKLARRAPVNRRGFFQAVDLAAGDYEVKVTLPGFAPASVRPVAISTGLECALREPVRLQRPVRLEVLVDPPVAPDGQGWVVSLGEGEDARTAALECSAGVDGSCVFSEVVPGEHRLLVDDQHHQRWADLPVEVLPNTPPFRVELRPILVEGRLFVGDDPASGGIELRCAADTRAVRFVAGKDGRFGGVVPQPGTWNVRVRLSGRDMRDAPPVEVVALNGGAPAQIEVRLPGGGLEGVVVDEGRKAVSGARIDLAASGHPPVRAWTSSDDDGRFSLQGLPETPVRLQASSEQGSSEWIVAIPSRGRRSPNVRLVLKRPKHVSGRVTSGLKPVNGARVFAEPWVIGSGEVALTSSTSTGVDGRFRLDLRQPSTGVGLLVSASGMGSELMGVLLTERSGGVEIALDGHPATLRVADRESARRCALVRNGGLMYVGYLLAEGLAQEETGPERGAVRIFGLAPGEWAICKDMAAYVVKGALAQGTPPPLEACHQIVLSPGGEHTITIP